MPIADIHTGTVEGRPIGLMTTKEDIEPEGERTDFMVPDLQ